MIRKTERVPAAQAPVTREPFPGSRKVHVAGSLPGVRVPMVQSYEQLLQNQRWGSTASNIDGSSHPHFGHRLWALGSWLAAWPRACLCPPMALPTSSRSPDT